MRTMPEGFTDQQVLAAYFGLLNQDISPYFKYNATDAAIGRQLVSLEGTPDALQTLWRVHDQLMDHKPIGTSLACCG